MEISKWIGTALEFEPLKLNPVQIVCKSQIRNTAIPSYQSMFLLSNHIFLLGWCVSVSCVWHGIYPGIVGCPAVPLLFQLLCSYRRFCVLAASLNTQMHTLHSWMFFAKLDTVIWQIFFSSKPNLFMEIELAFVGCQTAHHVSKCAVFCSCRSILFDITRNTQTV